MLSPIDTPREILQKILLFSMGDTPAGPPREFASLMLTCRSVYQKLNTPEVYTMVLCQNFDMDKPLRCLGIEAVHHHAKHELQRRFIALNCFRSQNTNDSSLTEALWVAYSMLEESYPGGKNIRQITWAGLTRFLDSYLRQHLYDGSASNNDWPLAGERNSLALALAWIVTPSVVVAYEKVDSQSQMLKLLAPYVFAAFRYPTSRTPEHLFRGNSVLTHRSSYDLRRPPLACSTRPYFGKIKRPTPIPSASLFATLLYFSRHETIPLLIPPHILKNRAEADALGRTGPTLEDVNDFIFNCRTLSPSLSQVSRMLCSSPYFPYQPGSATGSWKGSCIMPFDVAYRQWSTEPCVPSQFETTGRRPLYIHLKEYVCYDKMSIIPQDTEENGMLNAWLPPDLAYFEHGNGVEVSDPKDTLTTFYEGCREGYPSKRQAPAADVIIIGKTDERQSAAWGSFRVRGRVRLSDGLVVLLWTSLDGLEPTLFSGYLLSPQNFVGRQKPRSTGMAPRGWEAPFSLSKDNTPGLCAHL